MLIKIGNQLQQRTQEDEGFPMVCISFHIYVWIYSGSSRSKQAMASWSRKKKSQDWKWILRIETSMSLHSIKAFSWFCCTSYFTRNLASQQAEKGCCWTCASICGLTVTIIVFVFDIHYIWPMCVDARVNVWRKDGTSGSRLKCQETVVIPNALVM